VVQFLGRLTFLSYCEPCQNDTPRNISISSVTIEDVNYENYWQVLVNKKSIDLAYIFVKENDTWVNLAHKINLQVRGVSYSLKYQPAEKKPLISKEPLIVTNSVYLTKKEANKAKNILLKENILLKKNDVSYTKIAINQVESFCNEFRCVLFINNHPLDLQGILFSQNGSKYEWKYLLSSLDDVFNQDTVYVDILNKRQSNDYFDSYRYLKFPPIFDTKMESMNNDGAVFENNDGVTLTIGNYRYGLDESYGYNKDRNVTYRVKKKDWYVLSGYEDEDIFYIKVRGNNRAIEYFKLTYPIKDKEKYKDLANKLKYL